MIQARENELFEQWKRSIADDSGAIFVADGVVNETVWNNAAIKVLYLLKEVNGADHAWDERDYLAKYNTNPAYQKTHSPTIQVLTQWQYGISQGIGHTWSEAEQQAANASIQSELLSQICLVNLKKTAGGSIVDWSKFDAYFNHPANREYLRQQLNLYEPDIVVCGGTAWHLCQIKGWRYSLWPQTSRGVRYHREGHTTYLDFCHPNNRGPKHMIYFALLDALHELGF